MSITPSSLNGAVSTSGASLLSATPAAGFSKVLSSAMEQVNGLQSAAEAKVAGLIAGDGEDVHATAVAVERASLAFDLMLQVRNKVVSAYQEISRLQF
jgi:flagellar hook-basal body complex protein FliE